MKQRLLKTIALGLMAMVGVNAWADNNTSYKICVEGIDTEYTDLATAIAAVTDATLTNIYINDDITVSSSIEFKSGTNASKQVNILAGKEGATIKSGSNNRLFLVNSGTASLRLGGGSYGLIIDGDNKTYANGFISIEADKGKANNDDKVFFLDNVTIKNVTASGNDGTGYVYQRKNSGHDLNVFRNVTFDNCKVTGKGTVGVVRYLRQNTLYLAGTINFTNTCSGTSFYLDHVKCNLRNFSSTLTDLTISNNISVMLNWGGGFKNYDDASSNATTLLVLFNETNAGKVKVINGELEKRNTSDWKVWQAYRLNVTDANAATLVLPFEATIPDGAECYKLSYTSGQDNIIATKVTTAALEANTPVLVIATGTAEGTEYLFKTTATNQSTFSTGSEEQTPAGTILTGVYAETTPSSGDYILTKHDSGVGFRKANGTNNKVSAYHAYIKQSNVSSHPASAPALFIISFPGIDGTTDIKAVEKPLIDDGVIYNLQGVRMTASNLPRGIYVKNGRKFVVK